MARPVDREKPQLGGGRVCFLRNHVLVPKVTTSTILFQGKWGEKKENEHAIGGECQQGA